MSESDQNSGWETDQEADELEAVKEANNRRLIMFL
jgi:hypothetical protein